MVVDGVVCVVVGDGVGDVVGGVGDSVVVDGDVVVVITVVIGDVRDVDSPGGVVVTVKCHHSL